MAMSEGWAEGVEPHCLHLLKCRVCGEVYDSEPSWRIGDPDGEKRIRKGFCDAEDCQIEKLALDAERRL